MKLVVYRLFVVFQAFDDEDAEAAKQALSSPFIKHMDIEYTWLARDLPLPKGTITAPKASVIENAAPSYKSPNAALDGVSILFQNVELFNHVIKIP